MVRRFRLMAFLLAVGPLIGATSAWADASQSTNWAGYAIHRHGGSFRQVMGVWTAPNPSCRPGHQTFSSEWVGLGGFGSDSRALEQTGTEVDCTAQGQASAFAWLELVPAPSVHIRLRVSPGDVIEGTVLARRRQVEVAIRDLTRNTSFSKILPAPMLDVSSAEWIVEAPSDCLKAGHCMTLPLTDLGSINFRGVLAQSTAGHIGSISDPDWRATEIRLVPAHTSFVVRHRGLGAKGEATPSSLRSSGSAFTVSYSPFRADVAAAGQGRLVAGPRLYPRR